jgi:hypothetical protein
MPRESGMGRQNLPKPRQHLESATDVAWAVAVERERWIAKLAAEKYVRVHDADAAADTLDLTRTMIYRLVARYRRARVPCSQKRVEGKRARLFWIIR